MLVKMSSMAYCPSDERDMGGPRVADRAEVSHRGMAPPGFAVAGADAALDTGAGTRVELDAGGLPVTVTVTGPAPLPLPVPHPANAMTVASIATRVAAARWTRCHIPLPFRMSPILPVDARDGAQVGKERDPEVGERSSAL